MLDALRRAEFPRNEQPKLLVLSFPHNPTTVCVDKEFFAEVVELARDRGYLIIHDLAYADLVFDGAQAPSILQIEGAKDVAVEMFSMSKSYSMAGWRVGFCAGNRQAVAALTRANVTIYALDPRGMLDVERIADPTRSEAEQVNFRRAQDSLRVLAAETGGFAAVNQNDFSGMFDRIVRENSTYYILGYHPSNERRDGKFRSVDVRVTSHGLQQQASGQ